MREATQADLPSLMQLSAQTPVIIAIYAPVSPETTSVLSHLERHVNRKAGRVLLARINREHSAELVQALGAQTVPALMGLIQGQIVPLLEGEAPQESIERIVDELLTLAVRYGLTGTVPEQSSTSIPQNQPLQEAQEALERQDWDAAIELYEAALTQRPSDAPSISGLARARLGKRAAQQEPAYVEHLRQALTHDPSDVRALLALADSEVSQGLIEGAYERLLTFIRAHPNTPREREQVRLRLLELFDAVGATDERVLKARQALTNALF